MTDSKVPLSRTALDERERATLAGDLPDWDVEECCLRREIVSGTFVEAIELVRRIADAAEDLDHHPDIDIRWRTVRLSLTTHSAGSVITAYDAALAHRIDEIARDRA